MKKALPILFFLLTSLCSFAASYCSYVRYEITGSGGGNVNIRIWANSNTGFGEGVMAQIRTGASGSYAYTSFTSGVYDGSTAGANFRTDLVVPSGATNLYAEVANCNYGTTSGGYNYSGFPAGNFMTALVLPITLTEFNANSTSSKINLTWKTASERNNHFFEIEHSTNSISWKKIATIQGSGTSNLEKRYQYSDFSPVKGTNYYRLKQVDFDGTFTYSKIAMTQFDDAIMAIRAFPNPFSDKITFGFNGVKSNVQLFDVHGKLLLQKETNESELLELATENLATGIYFVTVRTEENTTTLKFVKE
jgi:hypothetical protein